MTSSTIKFVHDDRIIEIKNPNPNETLLNYVRTNLKKTGTKEGVALNNPDIPFLKDGDRIDMEIEKLGKIQNTVKFIG